jgi:hypothetical protein
MLIEQIYKKIKKRQKKSTATILEPTSVVSDIFPGQFNYCLDEIHLLRKYGNFIDITEAEHFQKMMPVIRLADFESFYKENVKPSDHLKSTVQSKYHLGIFTMATISGGHIMDRAEDKRLYRESAEKMLSFLIDDLGLEKDRLVISYFSGGATARQVEASIKKPDAKLKVETEMEIPEDKLAKNVLTNLGIDGDNLVADNSRDCFLTSNWSLFTAPWGYRNEIHYRLDNGDLLDIATIENLTYKPKIEERDGTRYVVDVEPWERCFVINGGGIERLAVAASGFDSIFDLTEMKRFDGYEVSQYQVEVLRMLHRIFTDARFSEIESGSRRNKINGMMKAVWGIGIETLVDLLRTNAFNYRKLFPDLKDSVADVIDEITASKLRIDDKPDLS